MAERAEASTPAAEPAPWARLGDLPYPEVAALLARPGPKVAILPVGSTEAHGPHLPLATDSILSEGMAEAGAAELARRGVAALVLPPTHYAVTEWARGFAGSTSIAPEVAISMLLGTCTAVKAMGFDRVVIVSAHLEPGHIAALREVTRRYQAALGEPLVFPDKTRRHNAARLTPEFQSGSCHAGQYETSLVLALRPDLVRQGLAAALPRRDVPLAEHIRAGADGFLACGMDQAYCGAPAEASADEGRRTLAALADLIADATLAALAPAP